ncbi:MAG TPA: DNA polymerase III subunit gamma/tau [Vicinamibacterales bacterium]|nr:DNA polymerase III subunit gamma/tau [Vicinamibacterales bacterium]
MSYQVIARKWRPQTFDEVVGQRGVTQTLKNALASKRLAQAFVFAGPRGVGKTTTARILARALNCVNGPTPDPCGACDACVEIAEGRDMDVLEIDAATHTGIDNVREVIISGLGILPVRNRFKVFIIDEVHQLSVPSFNALLKSIEEPPPHVVFMMATTELDKIPETVLSRSQVYEFRTIGSKAIAEQLRKIADAERIQVADDSLQLIARDAEGSMRDAQSKLDQVIAFTGSTIGADDVATVLGLVGRDLLFDAVEAVAADNAKQAFDLAARAVELGYDLRSVCRELSRVVRDLLVVSVDASRVDDPEIAGEGERDRVKSLAAKFSREDFLRAFDLLAKAETEMRTAAQPRYHLEMALLRWMYLRRLAPIEDLIAGVGGGAPAARPAAAAPPTRVSAAPAAKTPQAAAPRTEQGPPLHPAAASNLKDALLNEIRRTKVVFYNTVVAQAQKIEADGDRVTFTFSANHRSMRDMFEKDRAQIESMAQQVSGRRIAVASIQLDANAAAGPAVAGGDDAPARPAPPKSDRKSTLKEQALKDSNVQAMLEVFPAEIRDVEEM